MKLEHYLDSANRAPDWRWQRAVNIQDNNDLAASRSRDGFPGFSLIKEAASFRSYYARANNMGEFRAVMERFPHIFRAHQLYSDNTDRLRYALEANLLTERNSLEIAHLLNLPKETVDMYEGVFFNVKPYLQNKQYLLHCVIKPTFDENTYMREYDFLWKLYALFLGPYVLDAMQSMFPNPVYCHSPDNVVPVLRDDTMDTASLRASIAAKTLKFTEQNKLPVLELFAKLTAIARDAEAGGKSQDSMLAAVQSVFEHMQLHIGRHALTSDNKALTYDKSAVELNITELTQVSLYGGLPDNDSVPDISFDKLIEENNSRR